MNRPSPADICAAKWEAVSVEGSVPPRAMVGVNGESLGIIDESDRFPSVVFEAQVANLIAAAPDLYAACEAALPHHQGFHSEVGKKIREALKKARGES